MQFVHSYPGKCENSDRVGKVLCAQRDENICLGFNGKAFPQEADQPRLAPLFSNRDAPFYY